MLLLVLSRESDGCRAMQRLIGDSHERATRKSALRRRAWQLFRALVDRKIVEIVPRQSSGRRLQVNLELQDDFSLHQALSLYLIDTLPKLDKTGADYPYDVLTLCEAIVEDPDQILRRQVDKQKTIKIAEWKAAGIGYDERMAKLDEVEHPKPLREFLYETFNAFAAAHPWIEQENVRPKSIAREMFERYLSFSDYVRDYGLERSEGLLLRHLMQVWKVLAQTVPDGAKTDEVIEMEDYFHELIRGIDSSLIDEWERLKNPDFVAAEIAEKPARPAIFDITRDTAAFKRMVRTAILGFLQDIAASDAEAAYSRIAPAVEGAAIDEPAQQIEVRRIEREFTAYFDQRHRFRLDPEGRSAKHTYFTEETAHSEIWRVAQILVDPESLNDWEARFEVSLPDSRGAHQPSLKFLEVKPVGAA